MEEFKANKGKNLVINVAEVHPRKASLFLSKFVYQNASDLQNLGLALPETMEMVMVMREVGSLRILVATGASVIGELLGKRGWFYQIVGPLARDIDGPTSYVIEPYKDFIILDPLQPDNITGNAKSTGRMMLRLLM